jgi:flagellar motor switch protein FliG
MGAREVQKIGAAMTQLLNVSKEEVAEVLATFTQSAETQTSVGVGVDEFLRKVLVDALGQDKAASVIDRINIGPSNKGLEALKWMDPRAVAELIRHEHPQIIAIVLAYLDSDQSAEVLTYLPVNMHADIIMRVATLDGVQPSALSELDDIMEKQFAGKPTSKTSSLGGAKAAADIVNLLDASFESAIMEQVNRADEALGSKIQDLVFVFDNLIDIDDRGMQELLRNVQSDRLLLALKGADEDLKAKIFKNMSQRAAEMLKDDLEAKGPVKLSEVEAAQKEILQAARKLAEAGTISLGGKGGEQYV